MAKSLNTVTISGRLGFDPETKQLSNSSITEFTVAVDDSYKPKDGDLVEKTAWIRCKAWGRYPGEIIAEYLKKGDPIAVTGKLVQEEWTDKDTQKKQSKTLVQVESFIFMGGTKREGNGGQSSAAPVKDALDPDDDVPFN